MQVWPGFMWLTLRSSGGGGNTVMGRHSIELLCDYKLLKGTPVHELDRNYCII
jgi:hypothetical protein